MAFVNFSLVHFKGLLTLFPVLQLSKLNRTDNYTARMSLFNKLMKSKGLLGGKYSVGLDEEVVNIILDSFDTEEEIAKTQGGGLA